MTRKFTVLVAALSLAVVSCSSDSGSAAPSTTPGTTTPAAPNLAGQQDFTFAPGIAGTFRLTNSGGAPTSCTIGAGQTLPAGLMLSLADNSCQISGMASSEASATSFTIIASNAGGDASYTVRISVATATRPPAGASDTLVWSDEFEGASLSAENWDIQMGNGCPDLCGWGNNELQSYTDKSDNLRVVDGHLEIRATRVGGGDEFESARIRTAGKQFFRYPDGGTLRIEARMTLPGGDGLWPAFWMLPEDFVYGGWPQSGEIDIMEAVNLGTGTPARTTTSWATHYGLPFPLNRQATNHRDNLQSPMTVFHTYAIEWEEGEIRWYINDDHVHTQVSSHWYTAGVRDGAFQILQNGEPFDQDFHLLFNVAVGGNFPGRGPSAQTPLPQTLRVDYVRVYNCGSDESSSRCHKTTLRPNNFGNSGYTNGSTAQILTFEAFSDGLQTSNGTTFVATASASGAAVDVAATDGSDQVARLTFTATNGSVAFTPNQTGDKVNISGGDNFGHIEFDLKVEQIAPDTVLGMRVVDESFNILSRDYSTADLTRIMNIDGSSERQIIALRDLSKSEGSFDYAAVTQLLTAHVVGPFSSGQTVIVLDDVRLHIPCPVPRGDVSCGAGEAVLGPDLGPDPGPHNSVTLDVTSDTTTYPNTVSLYSDGIVQGSPLDEFSTYSPDDSVKVADVDVSGRGNVMQCTSVHNQTVCGLGVSGNGDTDLSDFSGTGFIEFDIRILTPPTDASAEMLFKYEANGQQGVDVSLGRASSFTTNDQWRRVRVDLNDEVWADGGGNAYDLSKVEKMLWLPQWGKAAGAVWQVDNVTLYRP